MRAALIRAKHLISTMPPVTCAAVLLAVITAGTASDAATPTPTVTFTGGPTTVPVAVAGAKALGIAPLRPLGTSTVLNALLRYSAGTISATKGTRFERLLAARLDKLPNVKATVGAAVNPYRDAAVAERQRVLPGVVASTVGSVPMNRVDVRKASAQNRVTPNFGQYETFVAPYVPAADAPPITYHLDVAGVRCNTPPSAATTPLVMISEIESTGTAYSVSTQFLPATGAGATLGAGTVSTAGAGSLYDAASRGVTTLGAGGNGVLLVTAVLQSVSAADAQAQRDRLTLLLATAEVYAAGLSGGSTLANMQTGLSFTMGILALNGTGYAPNAVQTTLVLPGDYAALYTTDSSKAGAVSYKWAIAHAMGANGDYSILLNAPTYKPPPTFTWDLVLSVTRPNITTAPVIDDWNTVMRFTGTIGDWTGYSHAKSPVDAPGWSMAPIAIFRRRSFNRAPMHVKFDVTCHGCGNPPSPARVVSQPTPTAHGVWCGDDWEVTAFLAGLPEAVNRWDWSGPTCPGDPAPFPDPAGIDLNPKSGATAIDFDVTSDGHITGDITGAVGQSFNLCGLQTPTGCLAFQVLAR